MTAPKNDSVLVPERALTQATSTSIPSTYQTFPTLMSTTSTQPSNIKSAVELDLPSGGGFIEPLVEDLPKGAVRITADTTESNPQRNPKTENKCGTIESKPPFAPCYSRQVADSLFNKCCRESVSLTKLVIYSSFRSHMNVAHFAHMNIEKM